MADSRDSGRSRMVGRVEAIFRYPVKSMLGESLAEVSVASTGLVGDRGFALQDPASGRVLSAKKWPQLFNFRATYQPAWQAGLAQALRITLPDGRTVGGADAQAASLISRWFAQPLALVQARPGMPAEAEIDPRTVFGEVAVGEILAGKTSDDLPFSLRLAGGSFCDAAALHLVTGATLERLGQLAGGRSHFDPRRFRPNILIAANDGDDSAFQATAQPSQDRPQFVEDGWVGGKLRLGDSVVLHGLHPTLRCVMTTHAQENLGRDPEVLRAAARLHGAMVGLWAWVAETGTVRVGDAVWWLAE